MGSKHRRQKCIIPAAIMQAKHSHIYTRTLSSNTRHGENPRLDLCPQEKPPCAFSPPLPQDEGVMA